MSLHCSACVGLDHFQAYDGHMNLILSDVEETIMIVDPADGNFESQGTVKVGVVLDGASGTDFLTRLQKGRWRCCLSEATVLSW